MKTWNEAKLVELDLNQTAGGSWDITKHDGVIVYTEDKDHPDKLQPSEQYAYVSGEHEDIR